MAEPLQLIEAIARITGKCFVWTHYYNEEKGNAEGQRTPRPVSHGPGLDVTYYELEYDHEEQSGTGFWGGSRPKRTGMPLPDILSAFRTFGLSEITMVHDTPDVPIGATCSFAARRGASNLA